MPYTIMSKDFLFIIKQIDEILSDLGCDLNMLGFKYLKECVYAEFKSIYEDKKTLNATYKTVGAKRRLRGEAIYSAIDYALSLFWSRTNNAKLESVFKKSIFDVNEPPAQHEFILTLAMILSERNVYADGAWQSVEALETPSASVEYSTDRSPRYVENRVDRYIAKILLSIGCDITDSGFEYLRYAVKLKSSKYYDRLPKASLLYDAIAKARNVSKTTIESAIRHMLSTVDLVANDTIFTASAFDSSLFDLELISALAAKVHERYVYYDNAWIAIKECAAPKLTA